MVTVAHGNVVVISSRLVTTDECSFGGVDDGLFVNCQTAMSTVLIILNCFNF